MLIGSNIFKDIYEGKVGKLTLQLNSFNSWSKGKHATLKLLLNQLTKEKYIFQLGRRNDYRISGGIGKSFVYLVPEKQLGHLYNFRGRYIHLLSIGHRRYRSMFAFKVLPKKIVDSYYLEKRIKVLAEREDSGMTSHWKEYLCLTDGNQKKYKIFEGRYEVLAEAIEFYSDDEEDYELPEFIDDKKVMGIEDGYVVGGELSYFDEQEAVEFNHLGEPALIQWLKDFAWDDEWKNYVDEMMPGIEEF